MNRMQNASTRDIGFDVGEEGGKSRFFQRLHDVRRLYCRFLLFLRDFIRSRGESTKTSPYVAVM